MLTNKLKNLYHNFGLWFWSRLHPCRVGRHEYDHDWEFHADSSGDPGVIGGTYDYHWYECTRCGDIDNESPPPDYDDYYDPAEWR